MDNFQARLKAAAALHGKIRRLTVKPPKEVIGKFQGATKRRVRAAVGGGTRPITVNRFVRPSRAPSLPTGGPAEKVPTGVRRRGPNPAMTTGMELIEDHFNVPHSGNDGGPFCEFGQVWYDHDRGDYVLGLRFLGGKRFIYPSQRFSSADAVVATMQGYQSASWACNPRSIHFDPRFGKGNYKPI